MILYDYFLTVVIRKEKNYETYKISLFNNLYGIAYYDY